jgi:hypothetical protein
LAVIIRICHAIIWLSCKQVSTWMCIGYERLSLSLTVHDPGCSCRLIKPGKALFIMQVTLNFAANWVSGLMFRGWHDVNREEGLKSMDNFTPMSMSWLIYTAGVHDRNSIHVDARVGGSVRQTGLAYTSQQWQIDPCGSVFFLSRLVFLAFTEAIISMLQSAECGPARPGHVPVYIVICTICFDRYVCIPRLIIVEITHLWSHCKKKESKLNLGLYEFT